MKVEVDAVGSYQRKLTVVIPPTDVRDRLDKAYRQLSRQVRLPGFRPGKAPRRVLEARYGESIEADVAQELIQRSWTDILEQGDLEPVGQPSVAESGEVQDAEGFRFIISVEVRPAVDLQQWKGLQVTQPRVDVSDDQVERTVQARLEGHARLEEIADRPAEKGDMALVELVVRDGEEEVSNEPGTMIRTAGDPYYPGIEDLVVGLEVGGEKEGRIDFGEDARVEAVAGRSLDAHVKLLSLQSYKVPELSDELAEELGYEGGADGMRAKVREELESRVREGARNQARANVLDAIIQANDFDVPEGMVSSSLEMLMQELRNQQAYQTGRDPRTIGFSDEQVADLRRRAMFAAKASLILEWVSEKESIEVTDEDLEARYRELADAQGQTVEAVKGWFAKESAAEDLRQRILEEKTLDWLLEQSELVEPPPAEESHPADEAGGSEASSDTTTSPVLEGSISDLREALESGDYDDRLDALLDEERTGRNRKGAVAALEARQDAIAQ